MSDYGEPRKVEYATYNPWTAHDSEREYVPVDNVHGTVTTPDVPYERSETGSVSFTLYLDPLTGLVVYDIGAYEAFLRERGWRSFGWL